MRMCVLPFINYMYTTSIPYASLPHVVTARTPFAHSTALLFYTTYFMYQLACRLHLAR